MNIHLKIKTLHKLTPLATVTNLEFYKPICIKIENQMKT